mgnify:CR=1 FL=1
MSELKIENLSVAVDNKVILRNISISVKSGEIIVIMGPNGSGKTTLAYTIMGHPEYKIINGRIIFNGRDITDLPPYERSLMGIFLAFQNPVEAKGIRLYTLINAMINKKNGERDLTRVKDPRLIARVMKVARELGLSSSHLQRELNVGFSGGEKKRAEVLQAIFADPQIIIFDEPDSGLDVDGVKIIAERIKELAKQGKGIIIITHYARLLKYLKPDRVFVLVNGRVLAEGDASLAERIEESGYESLEVSA